MADDNAMEHVDPLDGAAAGTAKRKTALMGGALLGIMAIEALVVLVLVKHFTRGPAAAEAASARGLVLDAGKTTPQDVEVEVVKLRAQNERSQRQVIYDVEVVVSVSDANKDKLNEVLQRRKATVQDRLARVIRAAEPERFTEPDLRTLRKQFQTELNLVVGDDQIIQEVLIPSIVASEN